MSARGDLTLVARAERLRSAVKRAGGNRVVSGISGVQIGTLDTYIGGRDMRGSAMIALARACNVSLDWLASGTEPAAIAMEAAAEIVATHEVAGQPALRQMMTGWWDASPRDRERFLAFLRDEGDMP